MQSGSPQKSAAPAVLFSQSQRKPKRLCDYFCVVQLAHPLVPLSDHEQPTPTPRTSPLQLRFNAEVVDRYPLVDHEDMPFPPGVSLFCLPTGLELSSASKLPQFFSFVHTSAQGLHIYGNCLLIYEDLTPEQKQGLQAFAQSKPGMEGFDVNSYRKIYQPKCLCLVSHWPFMSSFRKWLTQLYRMSLTPSTIPLERFICNFMNEVPAPPAGRVEVHYILADHVVSFKRPPANNPTMWSGVPFRPLFECLSTENILLLFRLVLVERQILFISSQLSLLTYSCETITSLLYPFIWSHVYVPILPIKMVGMLNAPMPYIAGVHSSLLDYIKEEHGLSDEIACVRLDEGRIDVGSRGQPPPLPDHRGNKLFKALQDSTSYYERRSESWTETRLPFFDSAFNQALRPSESASSDGEMVRGTVPDHDDHRVVSSGYAGGGSRASSAHTLEANARHAFLGFFVAILKEYRRFIAYGSELKNTKHSHFRADEFLAIQSADCVPFVRALLRTQAFHCFIDERVYGDPEDKDVLFFDESIDAKMNRYTFRLHKRETPFLSHQGYKQVKTYVAPTPDVEGLPNGDHRYNYKRFPSLDPSLYSEPRPMTEAVDFQFASPRKMKRSRFYTWSSPADPFKLTANACVYSAFLVMFNAVVIWQLEHPSEHPTPVYDGEHTPQAPDSEGRSTDPDLPAAVKDAVVVPPAEDVEPLTPNFEPFTPSDCSDPVEDTGSARTTEDQSSVVRRHLESNTHEERLLTANTALALIFDVLDAMDVRGTVPEEVIFQCVMDVCSRCGNTSKAVQLVDRMARANVVPDSGFMRMLVSAFAMERTSPFHNFSPADYDWDTIRKMLPASHNGGLLGAFKAAGAEVFKFGDRDSDVDSVHSGSITSSKKHDDDDSSRESGARPHKPGSRRGSANARGHDIMEDDWVVVGTTMTVPSDYSFALARQIQLGERVLELRFQSLVIDIDSETCPGCSARLCVSDIQKGWKRDPQVYTTTCPHCSRDFVACFSVFCSNPEWEGSQGPGTPLFCEFLSPWVLRKEVHTLIFNNSTEHILSESFAREKPTIFWNLIVTFRMKKLPIAFLISNNQSSLLLFGKPSCAEQLIQAGVEISFECPTSKSFPIHWAAGGTYVPVQSPDGTKIVSLHYRPIDSDERCALIAALAEAGANLDAGNFEKRTPLYLSVLCGDSSIALKLLQLGADPNVADQHNLIPLHALEAHPCEDETRQIIHEALVDAGVGKRIRFAAYDAQRSTIHDNKLFLHDAQALLAATLQATINPGILQGARETRASLLSHQQGYE